MMSPHLLLSLVVFAAGLGIVAVGVAGRRREVAVTQLLTGDDDPFPVAGDADVWQDQLADPITSRVLGPLAETLVERVRRLLPSSHLDSVRRRLLLAGLAGKLRAEEYVTLQGLGAFVGVLGAALVFDGTVRSLALSSLIVLIALFAPRGLVDNRRTERVARVQRELPDTIDLLAVSVEAGQALEGAMQTVAARGGGVLAAELRHTLREMELGVTRRGALEHLRDRLDVPDISSLVASLIQADTLGTPVAEVLRDQAIDQRRRRRQQVREQAAKLPVKMLLPLTFFILPALFVVVLGPAAMSIFELFAN
ncbi:type II secretion system F family protein [Nitriliruptoraceae bacterium ZYF776]|nr:type II secretion system F family protein [Profundirhabdus halotolerans]